jgi:undecaprenyl pyrophosphate phosphatase UppP
MTWWNRFGQTLVQMALFETNTTVAVRFSFYLVQVLAMMSRAIAAALTIRMSSFYCEETSAYFGYS